MDEERDEERCCDCQYPLPYEDEDARELGLADGGLEDVQATF